MIGRVGGMRMAVALVAACVSACSGSGDDASSRADQDGPAADGGADERVEQGADPITEPATTAPPHTGPSEDLAPSQQAASTVPAPATPSPCEPTELAWWTAQVRLVDRRADAVMRVRNDGAARCEVRLDASPLVDPAMEPDVWLSPGEWADLVLGPDLDAAVDCAQANVVTLALLDVNGTATVVPTAAVVPCSWWLSAFYVVDEPTGPCSADELETVVAETAVLLRTTSFASCELGELVAVTGAASSSARPPARTATSPPVTALAAGDVVAFATSAADDDECSDGTAMLTFETADGTAITVSVAGLDACRTVRSGAGSAYFDGNVGALRGVDTANDALPRLDPFGDGA